MSDGGIESRVAGAIRDELVRQAQDRWDGPWVDADNPVDSFMVDGYVNLIELAQAAIAATHE